MPTTRQGLGRALRTVLCLFIILVLILQTMPLSRAQGDGIVLGEPPIAEPGGISAASSVAGSIASVDLSSRAESRAYYYSQYQVAEPVLGTTGTGPPDCSPGSTPASFKAAVLQRINYYRGMAGAPLATAMDAAASSDAQQSALMMSINRALSHEPPPGWSCYTVEGDAAAGRSNLALGANGWRAIDLYMRDSGVTSLGHRRWILYPPTRSFATGDVDPAESWPANTLQVFGLPTGPSTTRDGYVAWPPPGYVPYQVVYPYWSFSMAGANFSSANVHVTSNGATVPVTVLTRTENGYGLNTIAWIPDGIDQFGNWPKPTEDTTYDITISNVAGGPYQYSVTVFDPAVDGSTADMTLSKIKSKFNGVVEAELTGFQPNTTVTVSWPDDTVLDDVTTDAQGNATATFRTPLVPYGTYTVLASGSGDDAATAELSVIPRIMLAPEVFGPEGYRFRVYLYGFVPGHQIEIKWYAIDGNSYDVLDTVTIADNGRASQIVYVPDGARLGDHRIRGDVMGVSRSASAIFTVTSAPDAAEIALSKEKSKYNGRIIVTMTNFTPNSSITVRWADGTVLAIGTADGAGAATTEFRTPLVPLGTYTVTATDGSGTSATTALRVIPRIMLAPENEGPEGFRFRVYFYGFSPGNEVEIKWYDLDGSSFDVLGSVVIADNGRASQIVYVPEGAPLGDHRIRGNVVGISRSVSTTFTVTAPEAAEEPTATPTETATATVTATIEPTVTVTPTTTATQTEIAIEQPTKAVAPTETAVATETPTPSETATPEPTPSLTGTDTASPAPVGTETATPEPTQTPATDQADG